MEHFELPLEVTGYASVKTSTCFRGILALNTGIVDAGYRGPLSSTLINFSSQSQMLRAGDVFLRVSFHGHRTATTAAPSLPADKYLNAARDRARVLPETFLDLPRTVEAVGQRLLSKRVAAYGAATAALVALIISLTTWSTTLAFTACAIVSSARAADQASATARGSESSKRG
jgi:hypothetical protein